jgi:hypothetical protein
VIFGAKRLLAEKDARIAEIQRDRDERVNELRAQISRLERLVFSPDTSRYVPLIAREADAILSGEPSQEAREPSSEELEKLLEEHNEASRILSGQY